MLQCGHITKLTASVSHILDVEKEMGTNSTARLSVKSFALLALKKVVSFNFHLFILVMKSLVNFNLVYYSCLQVPRIIGSLLTNCILNPD